MIPKPPVLVAVANDYEVVVAGVRAMLSPYFHRIALMELEGGLTSAVPADVLLYDTFGQDSPLLKIVASTNARRLVVFTWAGSDVSIAAALAAGASGYVAKGLTSEDLVDALERVNTGEVVIARGPAPIRLHAGDWPGREHDLSPREAEIIAWIARGLSNQDLADRAYLSVNTVKTYIRSAYRKMGVTTRSQAIIWALERGLGIDDEIGTPW